MWDGFNKRKFPRINVRCDLTIASSSDKSSVSAQTQNLGTGGACVIIDKQLPRFEKCQVQLFLGSKKDLLQCEGKIVWVVPTKGLKNKKSVYDTGIQFEELTPDQKEAIKKYISEKLR